MPISPSRHIAMACIAMGLSAVCSLGPAAVAQASSLRQTPIVKAVLRVQDSVVNIHGQKTVEADPDEDGRRGPKQVNGMGTGVIVDPRGYILTNHHVIEGVRRIQVTLVDRRSYVARLIARDDQTDLAVIKIDTEGNQPLIPIGTSADLMVGEPVIALGNAYGYHHTVTRGIISALHRSVQVTDTQKYLDLIQTDASINPGNSGGPLLNIDGEMIGINVAVRVGAQGIGFAIPVDKAMEIAAELMRIERVRGTWHGIVGDTVFRDGHSEFVVRSIRDNSPAEASGLRAGDRIEVVGRTQVERGLDVERALVDFAAGEEVPLRIQRNNTPAGMTIRLAQAGSRARTVARRTSPSTSPDDESDKGDSWRILGLRLAEFPGEAVQQIDERYRGGLRVTAVRTDSPAYERGIRPGDILVGMHIWETVSMDNIRYILGRDELTSDTPIKFYILRGDEVRYGHLPIIRR